MDETNKLQRSFVYIILSMLALLFGFAVYISCICYTPYGFGADVGISAKILFWYLILLPSAVLPLTLWLSNMLKPILSRYSLLSVWISCCFFIVIPRLYGFYDPKEMAVTTSAIAFFLISVTFFIVVKDLKKRNTKRWINLPVGIITTLVFIVVAVILSYFILYLSFFDRIAVCFAMPIVCLLYAISAILDVYALPTMVLQTLCLGYITLCSAFRAMNTRVLFFILMGLLLLTALWQVIDIIKYLRSKQNDSKSCNA